MAEKRMFSRKIVESDAFLDMPTSAQALYMHLGMEADDDGVVNAPNGVRRSVGASQEDLRLLVDKGFLLDFDSGVMVIKHWRINNTVQKDRYHPSAYTEEMGQLEIKPNGAYTRRRVDTESCIQSAVSRGVDTEACIQRAVSREPDTEIRSDKNRLEKISIRESQGEVQEGGRAPTVAEVSAYIRETGSKVNPKIFCDYYGARGWKIKGEPVEDWRALIRTWDVREEERKAPPPGRPSATSAQGYTQRQYAGDMINLFEDEEGAN